ncbi:SDR family NAD(P)-dependent oxidoreductase [Streptomyces griseorubiginosus]|uniref:SDR family NAD(P)-dependent oxidoreductase n=1 Tax=Streptomyces griseorubiginosus TaxID=67304 RepID=UPI0033BD827B
MAGRRAPAASLPHAHCVLRTAYKSRNDEHEEQAATAERHDNHLQGPVSTLTGASSGIGAAAALALAARGARVVLTARSADQLHTPSTPTTRPTASSKRHFPSPSQNRIASHEQQHPRPPPARPGDRGVRRHRL